MKYTIQLLICILCFALISCNDGKSIIENDTELEEIIDPEEIEVEEADFKLKATNIADAEGLYLIRFRRENTPTQYIDTLMIIGKDKKIEPLEFVKPNGEIMNICSRHMIPLNDEWILLKNDDARFQSVHNKEYSHYIVNRNSGKVKAIPTSANFSFSSGHLVYENMQSDNSGNIYIPGSTTIYKLNLNTDAYEVTPSNVTSFLRPYHEGHQDHFLITKENAIYCVKSWILSSHSIILPNGTIKQLFQADNIAGIIIPEDLCSDNQQPPVSANFFLDINKQLYFSCYFKRINESGKVAIDVAIFKVNIESDSLSYTKVAENEVLSNADSDNILYTKLSRPILYPQNGKLYFGWSYIGHRSNSEEYSILIFDPLQSQIENIKTNNEYIYSYHMDQYGPLYHTKDYLIGSAYVYSKHAFSSFNMNTYEEQIHTTENNEKFPLYEPNFTHTQTHIHYARGTNNIYFPKIKYVNGIDKDEIGWISHYSITEQKETVIPLGEVSLGEEIVIMMLD